MKSNILKQEKNPHLSRVEYTVEITAEATPSNAEIAKDLGKEELTVVKKVSTCFGDKMCIAEVVVYDSEDAKKKVEVIPQKIRKKLAEEEKARKAEEKKAAEEAKKAEEQAKAATEQPAEENAPAESAQEAEEAKAEEVSK